MTVKNSRARKVFEIGLAGYSGEGDFDHLILWVKAYNRKELMTALESVSAKVQFVGEADLILEENDPSIDAFIPEGVEKLVSTINHLVK